MVLAEVRIDLIRTSAIASNKDTATPNSGRCPIPFNKLAVLKPPLLTRCQVYVVQRIPVSDCATSRSRRSLKGSGAAMYCLVHSPQDSSIERGRSFQGIDTTPHRRLTNAGERDSVTAESISTRQRIPQQYISGVTVILERRIKDLDCERTAGLVT